MWKHEDVETGAGPGKRGQRKTNRIGKEVRKGGKTRIRGDAGTGTNRQSRKAKANSEQRRKGDTRTKGDRGETESDLGNALEGERGGALNRRQTYKGHLEVA